MIREVRKEIELLLERVGEILRKMRKIWFAFNLFLFLSSTEVVMAENPFGGGTSELPGPFPSNGRNILLKMKLFIIFFIFVGGVLIYIGKLKEYPNYIEIGKRIILICVILLFLLLLISYGTKVDLKLPNTTFTP